MPAFNESNIMKAVKASNHLTKRSKWGHSIQTILKEGGYESRTLTGVQSAAVNLRGPEPPTLDSNTEAVDGESGPSAEAEDASNVFLTAISPTAGASKSAKSRAKNMYRDKHRIEFQAGTNIVYGSYINLKCAQGVYLSVDPRTGLSKTVDRLQDATTFKVANGNEGNEGHEFGPVCFGDTVVLTLKDQQYVTKGGDVRDLVLGTKMAVDLHNVTRVNMENAAPAMIPCCIPHNGRKNPKGSWTIVHPSAGYSEKVKDKPVVHLGKMCLEIGWNRLTSVGRVEDGDIGVALREPPGSKERQRTQHNSEAFSTISDASANNRQTNRQKATRMPKKSSTVSGLTAAANMRWTAYLAMLGSSKEGGSGSGGKSATEQTLLRAQDQVYKSRVKRENRGEEFAFSFRSSMAQTYDNAEESIAGLDQQRKGQLYDRLNRLYLRNESRGWKRDVGNETAQRSRQNSRLSLSGDGTGMHIDPQHEAVLQTQEWPEKGMTPLQIATALADAARLKALVKSSVWAEISVQQRIMEAEEAEELRRAVIVLQRATRNWIQRRWTVKLEWEDEHVANAMENSMQETGTSTEGHRSLGPGDSTRPAGGPPAVDERQIHTRNVAKQGPQQRPLTAAVPGTKSVARTILSGELNEMMSSQSSPSLLNDGKVRLRRRPKTANSRMKVVPSRKAFGITDRPTRSQTAKRRNAEHKAQSVRSTNEELDAARQSIKAADAATSRVAAAQIDGNHKGLPMNELLNGPTPTQMKAGPFLKPQSFRIKSASKRGNKRAQSASGHRAGTSVYRSRARPSSSSATFKSARSNKSKKNRSGQAGRKSRPRTAGQRHLERLRILPRPITASGKSLKHGSRQRLKPFGAAQTMRPFSASSHYFREFRQSESRLLPRSVSGPQLTSNMPLMQRALPPTGPRQIDEHLERAEYHETAMREREKEDLNGRRRINRYIKSTEDARKGFVETNKRLQNPAGSGWIY